MFSQDQLPWPASERKAVAAIDFAALATVTTVAAIADVPEAVVVTDVTTAGAVKCLTEMTAAVDVADEATVEAVTPYDTVDLEMWPQTPDVGETRFRDAVREAALAAGGELLFDLPAEGLVADRLRIAVARIPDDDEKMRVVLATLDQDGAEIHLQMPDAATAHLVGFAEAFVGLFQAEALVGLFHQRTEPQGSAIENHDILAKLGNIRAALDDAVSAPATGLYRAEAAAA